MEKLDYAGLEKEITQQLRKAKELVLSTCAGGKVTARTMCHVNDGLTVLFSTDCRSGKVEQMRQNPNIALTAGSLRIEARAELFGHPGGHPAFGKAYAKKFPLLGKLYKPTPHDLLVICHPVKVSLYKYSGGPREDVLLPGERKAYRMDLSVYDVETTL